MKNFKIIILALLSVFILLFGACSCNSNSENGGILPRLEISEADVNLYFGEKKTIKAYSTLGDDIVFTSLDSNIASVSDSGMITAINVGETFIVVEAGDLKQSCKVTVKEETFSVSLDESEFNILVGTEITIKISLERNGEKVNEGASFTLSNTFGSATIKGDELNFKAQTVGQCKLVVTFGTASAECLINVVEV